MNENKNITENEPLPGVPVTGTPKFIPILFSGDMVKAILSGRKTQTRRTIKKQPDLNRHRQISRALILDGKGRETWIYDDGVSFNKDSVKCPYGQPGDILWVRETWQQECEFVEGEAYYDMEGWESTGEYVYRADGTELPEDSFAFGKWKPGIHMPKAACRLFLKVKSVRIERLPDICDRDAVAEGVKVIHMAEPTVPVYRRYDIKENLGTTNPVYSYQTLWEKINGAGSWGQKPFVWVIEFERIDRPTGFQ